MLRATVLVAAILFLIAACAVVSEPPPPGAREVEIRVKNHADVPVEIAVMSGSNVLPGAVQPSTIAPHALDDITFYLPIGDDWFIATNGMQMFEGPAVNQYVQQGCRMGMEVSNDGSGGIGCHMPR